VTSQPTRPSTPHAQHDRLLVVRHLAGDPLDDREIASVSGLLATCPECAALLDELALISRATATAAFPSRTRDFRLSPRDAARVRDRSLLRRIGDWLAAPGGAVLRPLAGAVLGIGLVMVVVGNVIPDTSAPAGVSDEVQGRVVKTAAPAPVASTAAEIGAPEFTQYSGEQGVTAAGSPDPAERNQQAGPQVMMTDASPHADQAAPIELATPEPTDPPTAARLATPEAAPVQDGDDAAGAPTRSQRDSLSGAIVMLGVALAAVGLLVLGLSLLARRFSQGPPVR
jgi:hypothetical protein